MSNKNNTAEEKRALLSKLLKEKKSKSRVLPASFAQRRLWLLDQMTPDSDYYNLSIVLELHGDLKVEALSNAFNKLINRHEVLRTTFAIQNGEPAQIIHPPTMFKINMVDLTGEDDSEKNNETHHLLSSVVRQPFNLETGPLFRVKLLRLDENKHLLILVIHHIITDGWSNGILTRELSELYRAEVTGKQAMLPDMEIQYADFALWQKKSLSGDFLTRQLNYWLKQLENTVPLNLPTDRARPAIQTFNGALRHQTLSTELTQQLHDFCQSHGVSLYMAMLACFKLLLQRYTSQDDISVGSPVANRNRAELENLIGFFVNSLVIRSDLSADPDFLTLLSNVKETALDAFDHQDIPFEKLVEELQPERNPSMSPLFQVMFTVQNTPAREFNLPGLRFTVPHMEIQTVRFDLEFYVWEQSDALTLAFVYNTDLFDEATIERMMGHYQNLLQAVISDPGKRLSEYRMMSAAEQENILYEWNKTKTVYPEDYSIEQIFEQQVKQSPDSPAVRYRDESITYDELNKRANRVAHVLIQQGIKYQSRVGLYMERGIDLIISLLAILKAGAVYVPLDMDYPESRIKFMAEDADISLLISTTSNVNRLSIQFKKVLLIDENEGLLKEQPDYNPQLPDVSVKSANDMAYIIYTSGSTGNPKGVVIPHRGVVRLVKNTNYISLQESDCVAQASNVSFDAATFEIWGALLNGAQLVGVDKETFLNVKAFSRYLQEQSISILFITTALFNLIAREKPDAFKHLRVLLFGGEAVDVKSVRRILARGAPQNLLHVYGPTESTTFATYKQVDYVLDTATTIAIGRPIANTTAYVLDPDGQVAPVGVPGELYLGGDGLALGYLNQKELTAEKFVKNPFDKMSDSRLYRTGDRVRFLHDGSIEFVGRFDNQVKLRGFRIELGEIEETLNKQEVVSDSVVLLREDSHSNKRLVAYVVVDEYSAAKYCESFSEEHIKEWCGLYDETYKNDVEDELLDLSGWNSSYTGTAIPVKEMQEWVDVTAARIKSMSPHRVLEIGCGTGLLLYRLAPECKRYVGMDFSAVSQAKIQRQLTGEQQYSNVELLQRMADDFSGISCNEFDTVIINSVTQYFPNIEYLVDVLDKAISSVVDGGKIFIGDVRNFSLLKIYHASVDNYRSDEAIQARDLLQSIQQHVEEENELTIDHAFFYALKNINPRIQHVEVLLKQGKYHNELSRYRYDVILHVASLRSVACLNSDNGSHQQWRTADESLPVITEALGNNDNQWLIVNGIPNARIIRDVLLLKTLESDDVPASLADARALNESSYASGFDPDALWTLAADNGFHLELTYSGSGTDGRIDALFRRESREQCEDTVFWPQQSNDLYTGNIAVDQSSLKQFANNPLKGKLARQTIPELMRLIQVELPEYMVPSVFIIMDHLPLTPNGKIDRKVLPIPGDTRTQINAEYMAPSNDTEICLAGIWCQVLKLDKVGVNDNFFDLGGHSLMATQVISRIRDQLGVELSLSEMFGYPTIADLSLVVDKLRGGETGVDVIPVASRDAQLPLSFSQERLWFLDQLEPGSASYNMSLAVRLKGQLNIAALEKSIHFIVNRHESLRSKFISDEGQPILVIDDFSVFELTYIDYSGSDKEIREKLIHERVTQDSLKPFDLKDDALLRGSIYHLAQDEHVLLLTMHHIVSDGWSLGILFKELGQCYGAFSENRVPELEALSIQYPDFSVWQRQWLSGEALDVQLNYWMRQLKHLPTLALPVDKPRPVLQTFNGAVETLPVSVELRAGLESLGKQYSSTLFMTLLSAYAILLQRYSAQDDIAIGTPIANRNRAELENIIGFFINMLVMRVDIHGDPDFVTLLERTQSMTLDAYQHQDVPFEKLVGLLQPERDRSRNPLFQVQFVLQNAPMEPLVLKGLELQPVNRKTESTRFDLECHVWICDEGLDISFVYNTDLFEAATIQRMLQHYQQVLQQVVAHPALPVSQLGMLTTHEQQLLAKWNQTEQHFDAESLVQLFEAQVDKTPEATAVVFENTSLSYQQFEQRANQLAHYLQSQGIGSGDLVGVCMTRSVEMVVALYAILKAGAAYVPLDPEYPKARLNFMLEDTGVSLVLSQSHLENILPASQAQLHLLDTSTDLDSQPTGRLEHSVQSDDAAYVIYTSGSTGQPKGVINNHRGIVNRLCWMQQQFGLDANDRVLQKTPYSFDVSVWEFFWPLMSGAQLVIARPDGHKDPAYLTDIMQQAAITTVHFVPSMLSAWLDQLQILAQPVPRELKRVMCSGEALSYSLQQQFFEQMPAPIELHNLYGPTEAAVDVTHWHCRRDDLCQIVPIGRAIANTRIYLLDKQMQPVPVGVAGELYIGGVQVAPGYLNRESLSAELFISDPFSEQQEARLYKTGDLARYLDDGSIEYLGRIDFQVKLRGQRIELGEIESALMKQEAINEAVVLCREDQPGEQQLVAYYTKNASVIDNHTILNQLKQYLPEYMIPVVVIELDELPLTLNGKIDRRALPLPDTNINMAKAEYVAPGNILEKTLAAILLDVLPVQKIGIHDNFFDLGGHSLMATRVVSRIRQSENIDMPVASLFENPTISGMADYIETTRWARDVNDSISRDDNEERQVGEI